MRRRLCVRADRRARLRGMSLTRFVACIGVISTFCAVVFGNSACGSRSGLWDCFEDSDCQKRDLCTTQKCVANSCVIVARTVCDDKNDCTDDKCDKKTGRWSAPRQLTIVIDGEALDRNTADAFREALTRNPVYTTSTTGADATGGKRLPFGFTYRLRTRESTPHPPQPATAQPESASADPRGRDGHPAS